MNYEVPPKPKDPKSRLVRVTDPREIAAICNPLFESPIGYQDATGEFWADADSLRQYRESALADGGNHE